MVCEGVSDARKSANECVGIHAVVVDAKDDAAKAYYERLGFIAFRDLPLSLFLPIASLRAAAPS